MQVIRHRRSSLVRVRVRVKSIRSFSSNKVGRKALSVVLGLVLLTALVLPSVLVYLLTLPGVSQTRLVAPVGFTNDCSGISPSSLWVIYDLTAMTMRINTSQCHFPRTPLYFTGLNGFGSHFCVSGYNAISSPTPDSFQVHARSMCLTNNATYLVSFAQSSGYDLFWTGFSS